MTRDWKAVTLGDVIVEARDKRRVEADTKYPLAGVLGFGRGVLLREPVRGADISAQFLYRIRAGQLVYSRLKAFEGAFALVPSEADGRYVSNEFPTFDVDSSAASPQYLALFLARPRVWEELESGSEGMGARRERLQPNDFLGLELDLPPLDEQEHFVSTVVVTERALQAANQRTAALERAFLSVGTQLFAELDADDVRLGDVTRLTSGGTPARKDPANFGGRIPWAKTGEVKFNRLMDTEEHLTDAGLSSSSAKLLPAGTVVVAMYGQGATRGRCALLGRDMATNQACAAILPSADLDPEYLFFYLWNRYESIRAESEGSAQDNLNQAMVSDIELPLPSLIVQRSIADKLSILRCAADAHCRYAAGLTQFRATLIEAFITGEHLVPRLVGAA